MAEFYIIKGAAEETTCDQCGAPMLSGERAYPSEDEREVFCSASCRNLYDEDTRDGFERDPRGRCDDCERGYGPGARCRC